jgi:hypothetical protein
MEIEGKDIQDTDNMMVEVCSFEYKKKRKNPYTDIDKAKYRPYLINNTLKNIIEAKHQNNK